MGYYGFSSTEVNFFNKIKSEIDVMFDIGSRDDTDYLENSLDKSRSFHVFEPDPNFLISCQKQIEKLDAPEGIENEVYLNNFGLGSQEGELEYYPNTQSFVFRTVHTQSVKTGVVFPIKTLDGYCKKNKIKHIDFMKIDIEGMEIDVFNGGKEIINNGTDIIQFEFASTMLDRDLNPDDLVGWFDRKMWSLFLLRVEHNHPFYSQNNQLLTKLDDSTYQRVRQDMIERSGCNLVAIKKELSDKIYKLANHD
jgi:FkbM family methyltransferase